MISTCRKTKLPRFQDVCEDIDLTLHPITSTLFDVINLVFEYTMNNCLVVDNVAWEGQADAFDP